MASLEEQQRLRRDIGLQFDDEDGLSVADADDAYARAALYYTNPLSIEYSARVITLEQLWAQAVTRTDYTQNETVEKRSQLFTNYEKLLKKWQDKLAEAEEEAIEDALSEETTVRFGRSVTKPSNIIPSGMYPAWPTWTRY